MPDKKYDVIVLGAGPAGYSAAIRAAQLGKKVCIIERYNPGGTCLSRGCIPTKTIIASIELFSKIKKADKFGISVKDPQIDLAKVIQRKNKVVISLTKGVQYLLKQNKIELIKGEGILKEPGLIEIPSLNPALPAGRSRLSSQSIIIATGSEPIEIPGFKFDHKKIVNSNDMLNLTTIPKTMEIIGCGAIGLEFAHIFTELGTKVTICEALPKAMPMADEEITNILLASFKKKGIEILLNTKRSAPSGMDITLVAVGRKPNTNNGKFIKTNNKMETETPGVYAVGDVTGISMQSHVAFAQGKIAAENACGIQSEIDYSAIPMCIYTNPEVAAIGLTEAQAKAKGMEIKTGKFPFMALGKARAIDETEGIVKLISDAKTDKILGAHIIGPGTTMLIPEIALAMKVGATAKDIAKTMHAHPTLPEAVQEAAESIFGQAIHI